MNIIYAILLWMIGLKLGMSNGYYIVIIIGAVLPLFVKREGKNSDSIYGSD